MRLGLVLYFFLGSDFVFSKEPIFKGLKGNHQKIVRDYLKIHKNFSKALCRPGTEEKFWKKFRTYQGKGSFIPTTHDGKLDTVTLNRFIPELEKKIDWIDKKINRMKRMRSFRKYQIHIEELENIVKRLLVYKEQYYDSSDVDVKIRARNQSKYLFLNFKKQVLDFFQKISFLLSYRYPVNHFELRENYDEVKHSDKPKLKQRSNEIYFYRRIVQDGAQNKNNTGSDTFLRASLDTIYYEFQKSQDFISEKLRFDIISALGGIRRHTRKSPKYQLVRLREWKNRTWKILNFYKALRAGRVKVNNHFETGEQLILSKAKATYDLKTFNFKNQQQAYKFWKEQLPLFQSIFVIETILFNEVGSYDRKSGVERKDVAQVVINRHNDSQYNYIPQTDDLYYYLTGKKSGSAVKTDPWLNVLFKEGEFSFSYFFIHGSVRIYCPDSTRSGRRLRHENIQMALRLLEQPNESFRGVRYFSRASMLGKIDMSSLWSHFEGIPEKPGRRALNSNSLKRSYQKGQYDYHYHFLDGAGQGFKVIRIRGKNYALNLKTMSFFEHRSPHYFRYFQTR